jgi:hypothetical protein
VTGPTGPIRLTDVLSNAAAIADMEAAPNVGPGHLLRALEHLRTSSTLEPRTARSPLGRGGRRAQVTPAVRNLAQRWYTKLGREPTAELSPGQLDELEAELRQIESATGMPPQE